MKRISLSANLILLFGLLVSTATAQSGQQDDGSKTKMATKPVAIEKLSFESKDGLTITADLYMACLLYTSPSPRDRTRSRMPSSA